VLFTYINQNFTANTDSQQKKKELLSGLKYHSKDLSCHFLKKNLKIHNLLL